MIIAFVLLLVGLVIIWKSSDWLTDSLVPVAKKLGTSYIAITTLLVSLILSLPEIFSSVYSYMLGHLDIGLGVIIGSVMANIGLIVGLSALIKPLRVNKAVVMRDGVFLIIMAVVVLLFGSDLQYQRSEGMVLLLLFIPYALNVWFFEKWRPSTSQRSKVREVAKNLTLIGGMKRFKLKASMLTFFISAALLVGGSYLFSYSLVEISKILPIPGILVGLVFGAIGTGMPNIAAAIQGTRKGYRDAAITETFGANIFTLLITLGILIVLSPFTIAGRVFYFDLTWMIVMNVLLVAFIAKGYYYKEDSLTRYEGVLLLLFYLVLLMLNAVRF